MTALAHQSFVRPVLTYSRRWSALLVVLLLQAFDGWNVRSQVITVPNALAEVDGNTFIVTPDGDDDGARNINVYDASQFKALTGPAYLTRFALRADPAGGPFGPKTGNLRILISTTPRAIAEVTTQMDDNIGADATLVFDGSFSSSTENLPGPGNTRQFDIVYAFTRPFLYNPANGNLVVDFQVSEGHGRALRFDAVSGSPVAKTVFTPGSTTRENGQVGDAFVAQFTFEPAPLVTIRPSQVDVCWASVSSATYRVEWRPELGNSEWTSLINCVRSTSATTCIQDTVASAVPRKIYRVVRTNCVP